MAVSRPRTKSSLIGQLLAAEAIQWMPEYLDPIIFLRHCCSDEEDNCTMLQFDCIGLKRIIYFIPRAWKWKIVDRNV